MTDKQTGRQRRQLRNFLLDRKMQLRITVIMVLITAVLTAGLGYFWYAEMRKASDVIRVNAMATLGEVATKQLENELAGQDRLRLLLLAGFAGLLALLIAGYGIVMTHKLAGPLFKITRHMSDIERNRIYKIWDLRKGDQRQDFFAAFKAMHGALRSRTESDMLLLNKLVSAIERGDDMAKLLPIIKEALQQKGDSLRDASEVTQQIKRPDLTA